MAFGSKEPVSVEMRGLDTRFPYMLVLPQEDTEEILVTRLNGYGVAVERGVELLGVPGNLKSLRLLQVPLFLWLQ